MEVAGNLTGKEVSFLLQYAINQLMANGVLFDLTKPETTEDGEEAMRINVPVGANVH